MTSIARLTDQEQATWRAFLLTHHLLEDALDRQVQTEAGITHSYYVILVALLDAPANALRMSDLATMLSYSQSRLTHAINRLEREGWVERQQCPTDRRGLYTVLTEAGKAKLRDIAPGHVTEVRTRFFDRLTDQQTAQLGEICETLLRGFEPGLSPAAGGSSFGDRSPEPTSP